MTNVTVEQLANQIARLELQDQLKLVSLVSAQLSTNITALPRGSVPANQHRQEAFQAMLAEVEAHNEAGGHDANDDPANRQQYEARWWEDDQLSTGERSRHLQNWLAENEAITADIDGDFDSAALLRRIRNED